MSINHRGFNISPTLSRFNDKTKFMERWVLLISYWIWQDQDAKILHFHTKEKYQSSLALNEIIIIPYSVYSSNYFLYLMSHCSEQNTCRGNHWLNSHLLDQADWFETGQKVQTSTSIRLNHKKMLASVQSLLWTREKKLPSYLFD